MASKIHDNRPRFPRRKSDHIRTINYHALHKSLAGVHSKRGPFQSAHGWAYYVIDAPGREISIRLTKENGQPLFIVRENFGRGRRREHKCLGQSWLRIKLQALMEVAA